MINVAIVIIPDRHFIIPYSYPIILTSFNSIFTSYYSCISIFISRHCGHNILLAAFLLYVHILVLILVYWVFMVIFFDAIVTAKICCSIRIFILLSYNYLITIHYSNPYIPFDTLLISCHSFIRAYS